MPAEPASKRKQAEEGTSASVKKRKTLFTAKETSAPANIASSSTAAPESTAPELASEVTPIASVRSLTGWRLPHPTPQAMVASKKCPSYVNPWRGNEFEFKTAMASSFSSGPRLREHWPALDGSFEHLDDEPPLLRRRRRESLRPVCYLLFILEIPT